MKYTLLQSSLLKISGEKAGEFLQGICTNDVKSLKVGSLLPVAFLDRIGKVLAVSALHRIEDYFLVQSDFSANKKLFEYLSGLAEFSNCKVEDLSEGFSVFAIFNSEGTENSAFNLLLKTQQLIIEKSSEENTIAQLKQKGFAEMAQEDWENYRIGNRVPVYGKDYDNNYMVLELGLDNLISYTKGCYTGQEIVARMKNYGGEAPRKIVKLKFESSDKIKEKEKLFKNGHEVGFVTSVGEGVCLGTVKKGFFEKDVELETNSKVKLIVD